MNQSPSAYFSRCYLGIAKVYCPIRFLRHQKWVDKLLKDGKIDALMKRVESLGRSGDSYTDVWKAIKEML